LRTIFKQNHRVGTGVAVLAAGVRLAGLTFGASGQEVETNALTEKELVHEIFNTMVQVQGVKPGYRVVHANGKLPNAGDPTKDPSIVWPEDRRTMDLGKISIISMVADSSTAEQDLAFDPTSLTDGIELSDDPFPSLRSKVYALAVLHRQ